jgi:uncharacterized protein DUF5946
VRIKHAARPIGISPCSGCGAVVPASAVPTHAYLGASSGCWAKFGEILAKEYGDRRFSIVHRLTVDAYAVQHPGKKERRTIQSVAVHLIALYLVLELGLDHARATDAIKNAASRSETFKWLTPPASVGQLTVLDVAAAGDDADEHARLVAEWARCAWDAWAPHHAQIRAWAAN